MGNVYRHLSDEDLLLFADGELPPRQIAAVNAHLASCWECRSRLRELDETIADFVHAHHDALDAQLPPVAGPRALLKARLAEAASLVPRSNFVVSFRGASWVRTLACAGAALIVAALTTLAVSRLQSFGTAPNRVVHATPDPRLTPGAARLVSASDVCSANYSDDTHRLPASIQQKVLQEYGMDAAQSRGYELDYLISPQLGGTDDIRNLWPEPASSTEWNVRAKDALEDRLYDLVCQGKLQPGTAQQELATDWIAAYKRYFHTDRPIEPL